MHSISQTILTLPDVVPYLLQRNLVSPESVVHQELTVIDASSRNQNFGVLRPNDQSYLLKQGIDPQRKKTIANEAQIYELIHSTMGKAGLTQYLPRFFDYDSARGILVIEYLSYAQNLHNYCALRGRFSKVLGAAIGDALSSLHQIRWDRQSGRIEMLAHGPPGILSIHRPELEVLRDISGANVQVIKIIQRYPEFTELLDELRDEWRSEALIHFDFKWDNCLVTSRTPSGRKTRLKIVDWELAGIGDPIWDVASVLNAYLSFWILSIPITGETPPDRFFELARFPLEGMQPAIRSFWNCYVDRMSFDKHEADVQLIRAVRYAAARLVQTTFEQMHTATELIGSVVCSLQLSLNILRRPKEASTHLLGIPPALA